MLLIDLKEANFLLIKPILVVNYSTSFIECVKKKKKECVVNKELYFIYIIIILNFIKSSCNWI